jgi:hypothetical protein
VFDFTRNRVFLLIREMYCSRNLQNSQSPGLHRLFKGREFLLSSGQLDVHEMQKCWPLQVDPKSHRLWPRVILGKELQDWADLREGEQQKRMKYSKIRNKRGQSECPDAECQFELNHLGIFNFNSELPI